MAFADYQYEIYFSALAGKISNFPMTTRPSQRKLPTLDDAKRATLAEADLLMAINGYANLAALSENVRRVNGL